jgi:hypothetical protein
LKTRAGCQMKDATRNRLGQSATSQCKEAGTLITTEVHPERKRLSSRMSTMMTLAKWGDGGPARHILETFFGSVCHSGITIISRHAQGTKSNSCVLDLLEGPTTAYNVCQADCTSMSRVCQRTVRQSVTRKPARSPRR